MMKRLAIVLLVVVAAVFINGCDWSGNVLPWIDTHTHPLGTDTACTSKECIEATVTLMDTYGVRKAILMHPPAPGVDEEREVLVRTAVSHRPDRFFYGGGGNTLNALIQKCPDSGEAPDGLIQQFDQNLQALIDAGDVAVFGETASLHLSYYEGHSFEEKPANSALFLRLADNASQLGIPIDIHMDVVQEDMTTPAYFTNLS